MPAGLHALNIIDIFYRTTRGRSTTSCPASTIYWSSSSHVDSALIQD